jgi:hypothetical protein
LKTQFQALIDAPEGEKINEVQILMNKVTNLAKNTISEAQTYKRISKWRKINRAYNEIFTNDQPIVKQ